MKKRRILILILTLALLISAVAVFAFAAPGDLTVRKSADFETATVGYSATASDGKNPTVGGVTFQQGGRTGKVEVVSADGNRYALITQTDKVGSSTPYAYIKVGNTPTVTKDSAGTVTALTPSATDIRNFKYMVFEVDVMSPTGKFIAGNIDIQGRRASTTSNNSYWNPNATSAIVKFGNSGGATYLYAGFDSTVKKYINPYDFTKIQIIIENITTEESTNIEIKSHVYVDGEFWFTKEASNTPTSYALDTPNAVFTEIRVNYTTSTDSTYTLAIDNLSYSTVPTETQTKLEDLVYDAPAPTPTVEYVSGGETVVGYDNMSIANAVLLADDGSTVKLLSDCVYDGPSITVNKNLTLDLNGKTIDSTLERTRRDGGIFVVSASKTFTLKSSAVGGKIFSAASGNSADPVIGTNSNSVVNVIGADTQGNTTLSLYGGALIRAWSGDCEVTVDGGEYYRNRASDYAIIQLQKNFTLTVKNALLYDMSGEATDGVFCLNGRYAVGTSTTSNATVDNCVIYSKTNIATHAFNKANIVFTNCYLSGDIKPEVFSNADQGTQTVGYVTLGDGCYLSGEIADNVITASGVTVESVPAKYDLVANYNTYTQTDGKYDDSSFVVNGYEVSLEFDRLVCEESKLIPVVWKDAAGKVIATTVGVRGTDITSTPYDQFVENGAFVDYIEGFVDGVIDEWCESLTIPHDYIGSEYVLTAKDGGKIIPYKTSFPLLFNVTAESNYKINFFLPELPEGMELISAAIGDKVLYENGEFAGEERAVVLDGKNYYVISDLIGVLLGATEKINATVVYKCDGYTVTQNVSTDMAYYCNTVLGSTSRTEGKELVVNIANYLVACADALNVNYTDITNALKTVIENNSDSIVTPDPEDLVIPDSQEISTYISGVSVVIDKYGPCFVFNLTEEGKRADISLSTEVCNANDEPYSTVGWIKTGNVQITDINRTAIKIRPAGADEEINFTYTLANYCKALEGNAAAPIAYALYGYTRSQMKYSDILDISAEKYTSHSEAVTISPNEKLVYYITVTNNEKAPVSLAVTDTVPENTTYVSGADTELDGILTWNVEIPAGESVTVSYTVRVDNDPSLCDGGIIESTVATVGKLEAVADSVYVEITFNSADEKYIGYAIDALADSTFKDLTLAKWIYYVAYSSSTNLGTEDSLVLINSIIDKTATADVLDLIAPNLYGGTLITEAINGVKGAPVNKVSVTDLVSGDIIVAKKANDVKCYIYGNEQLYSLGGGCTSVDMSATLPSLSTEDAYAVFRPSAKYVNFTPTDLDKTPDVLTEKQKALVDTAKYYLQRGEWLQYDDTYLCYAQTVLGNESRWEAGLKSPEEYISQNIQYINCAAFTHDVYWTTFGYKLPGSMFTTQNLSEESASYNMKMYSFTRAADQTHTAEEKAKVEREFMATLQPGDIMVIRRGTSGHAMLYIGDGLFIHSSGSSYNYSGSYGVETYEPTIRYHRVKDYFFRETSTNGYIFGKVTDLCIVRPLNNATWAGYEVTENSQNRLDNLMGITVQKLPSVGNYVTVNRGDEITYTFSIRNDNYDNKTLDIVDKIPAYTTYVSGGDRVDGDTLFWTVTVPARTTVEVSYTVKVSESAPYGTEIVSNDATVGGVLHKTYKTIVNRTLTAEEQAGFAAAFEELKNSGTALRGIAFANALYKEVLGIDYDIFADTDLAVITEGDEGVFTSEGLAMLGGKQAYKLASEGKYLDLLVSGLYGGRRLSSPPNEDKRTALARPEHLVVGDILIGRTSSSRVLYMYIGDGTMVSLTTLANDTTEISLRLERLPAYAYHYAIFRPSYGIE